MGSNMKNFLGLFNPIGIYLFFSELYTEYGIKYNLMIISVYTGVRGSVRKFLDLNETLYYKEAGFPASVNQANAAIAKLPGATQGIGGLLSDLLPFAGYEKSSYMIVYTIMGSLSLLALSVIQFENGKHSATLPALLFFLANTQVVYSDLLLEGKSIELMKDYPKNRGSLVAFSFFCIVIGGFPAAIIVGFFGDYLPSTRYTFLVALPFSIQPIIFTLAGCLVRDKASPGRNNKFDYRKARKQLPVILMNIAMTLAAVGNFFFGIWTSATTTFIYCVVVSIVLNLGSFLCMPIVVAFISLYLFLGQTLYLQIQPTLEYFYLADEACVPGGPHFDAVYLKTYVGLVTQAGQLVGLWLYRAVLTKMRYRQIFWVSTLIRCLASFFDYMIVMRINIKLGISDRYFYLIGHAIVYEITYMLDYLPFSLMIAKVCPKNIEVSLYAVIGGFALYGGTISMFTGNFVAQVFGIKTGLDGGACNFKNIGTVVLICNLLLPATLIPLAFLLIPNKRVGENIADQTWENSKFLFPTMKFHKAY